jgi:hypothetical protein
LNGGGVRASAAARSAPARTFTAIKIGHGGGVLQSDRSASSLCGCSFDIPIIIATATTAKLICFAIIIIIVVSFATASCFEFVVVLHKSFE